MRERPRRVQRKRTKGWRMPPNMVYVGRPTKWGNPFRRGSAQHAVHMFRWLLRGDWRSLHRHGVPLLTELPLRLHRAHLLESLSKLRGKNLACWCPLDQPCHADVLLEIANAKGGA